MSESREPGALTNASAPGGDSSKVPRHSGGSPRAWAPPVPAPQPNGGILPGIRTRPRGFEPGTVGSVYVRDLPRPPLVGETSASALQASLQRIDASLPSSIAVRRQGQLRAANRSSRHRRRALDSSSSSAPPSGRVLKPGGSWTLTCPACAFRARTPRRGRGQTHALRATPTTPHKRRAPESIYVARARTRSERRGHAWSSNRQSVARDWDARNQAMGVAQRSMPGGQLTPPPRWNDRHGYIGRGS